LPTEADEDWRYGRIDSLELGTFAPVLEHARPAGFRQSADVAPFESRFGKPAAVIRTLDGAVVSSEFRESRLSAVATSQLSVPPDGFNGLVKEDAFTLLALAFAVDAVVIDVAAGEHIEGPVIVLHRVSDAGARRAVFPRTFVSVGPGAEVEVIEHYSSDGSSPLVCPITELVVGEDAHLRYHAVQELDRSAWQLGYLSSAIAKAGELRSFTAAVGADYSRLNTASTLDGESASSELLAGYFADGSQVVDMRTFQDHAAALTTSRLVFKGAVDDDSRSVYSGLIRIEKGARKSDASQTNRNLVLSAGAHADSVPNLDIQENDVRCSHASAVGPIDRDQLYYVTSRGVRPEVAERLILLGFFDDLLARVPNGQVAGYVRRIIADRLHMTNLDSGVSKP
jgi:Fe-S cluster assembly protein SufD